MVVKRFCSGDIATVVNNQVTLEIIITKHDS